MKKIYLIDFNDSFVWNIYSEVKKIFPNALIKLVNYSEISQLDQINLNDNNLRFILGPGPGHPQDYLSLISPFVEKLLLSSQIKIMGVCLGHQIISMMLGLKVESSSRKMHGEQIKIKLPDQWKVFLKTSQSFLKVVRYNSLAVNSQFAKEKLNHDFLQLHHQNELMGLFGKNIISYQFHPESIGSENSDLLFRPLD